MSTRIRRLALVACLGIAASAWTVGSASARPGPQRSESITRPDGLSSQGRLIGDAGQGFRFSLKGNEPTISMEKGIVVTFDGPGADAASGFPPMRVLLGVDQQISGKLGTVDDASVVLEDGPGGARVVVARPGAIALAQRPGEALVFQDGFETLDPARWDEVGEPSVVETPRLVGSRSLAIPAGGSAVTHRLSEPVGSGRLEVAFHDTGQVIPGQQWFVDLYFRGASGPESIRAVLDGSEESLAVQSSGGPALAVQRLARKAGWHRLSVRFGPETELAVDGDELAHGRGPSGPLVEIRLANRTVGNPVIPKGVAAHFDDLRLVRLAEPVGGLEVTPRVDDVRMVDGDQVFGRLKGADVDGATLLVDGQVVALPWTEVASLQFQRSPKQARAIDGLLVRLEWRSAPGNDARDLDQVEGALIKVDDVALTVATPYAGDLIVPRDRLRKLKVIGQGKRVVLDATSHHLGNEVSKLSPLLDPPMFEGGTLERVLTLDKVPDGPAFVVLDVILVVGEANSLQFSELVRKGEIRTNVRVNDKLVDYLNRHITTKNETPERIRLPIPAGLLHLGENKIRIEQIGKFSEPEELDDLGILTFAVEFDSADKAVDAKP